MPYPPDVACLVVLWRVRYKPSLRTLAAMFLVWGVVCSHEAVREWETKLAPLLGEPLRKRRRGKVGRNWYCGETYLKVKGRGIYLYRAIDRDGNLVDILLSERQDQAAAEAFLCSARTVTDSVPDRVTTGGHSSHLGAIKAELGGKRWTQQLERKHLTLRTRIKRLVRKTICFSRSVHMHDIVIGLFINRFEFGLAV